MAGSNTSIVTRPCSGCSVRLKSEAESMVRSPSRTKRGRLSWAITSFCATTSSEKVPAYMSSVCARAMNFHVVSPSGSVNRKVTMPAESAIRRG